MKRRTKLLSAAAGVSLAAVGILAATGAAGPSISLTPVPNANEKTAGLSRPNLISPELQQVLWAQGANKVENPSNGISYYGYDDGGTFVPVPGPYTPASKPGVEPVVTASLAIGQLSPVEANKTEPDKNTYLVLDDQKGADPNYDYGRHFLFQGHELGAPGYITRINLDADGPHRVTLLATKDTTGAEGTNLPNFDGSTWDPWAKQLLLTSEGATSGGVWQSTLDGTVGSLQAFLGVGGYEGIQNDDRGNLYIVEDVGGPTNGTTKVKPANSFVYRFLPKDASDLTQGGTIQALQVLDASNNPITFADGGPFIVHPGFSDNGAPTDVNSNPLKYKALHEYGSSFKTKWVNITTTLPGATLPGPGVNALAKTAGATPFKRPENGVFQPGSKFRQFYFTETGDTNAPGSPATAAAAASGGWGSVFALKQDPKSNDGSISIFYNGNLEHAAFDNVQFFGENQLSIVEDRGDTLHGQQVNGLDSAWILDTTVDYANAANKPTRFIAEGRDASATIDSALSGLNLPKSSFQNDGDNEITGIHVSDGDPGKKGILGAKKPKPFQNNGKWRVFWTQQHGDNNTWELIPTTADRSARYDDGE